MDVWTAIRTKRMVRDFQDRPLAAEHLTRILDAGRHAGSSKNLQRWDFIAVEDPATRRRLAEVGPYAGHIAAAAVAIALVTPDPHATDAPLSITWDSGLAAENMLLAAWELGVGGCPATVYNEPLAREILGYPADRFCGYILSFGYPRDAGELTRPPKAGGRRSLEEITHRDRW
jgi:nitroreductase